MTDNPQWTEVPPPAAGARLQWLDLPVSVRAAVERWLGSGIASAATQTSGFSPEVAARLQTADGRRVFVKAVGPEPNLTSPEVYRQEARIVPLLPAHAPVPRLLWTYDEGEDGWGVLAFEDIEGWHPHESWREDELARVLETLVELARVLTPSPVSLESASAKFERNICGWRWLRKERPASLDDWSCRHLEALAALEAVAGFFTSRALQPPPPGLPTLRPFQAAQGRVARRWVARRTGWE